MTISAICFLYSPFLPGHVGGEDRKRLPSRQAQGPVHHLLDRLRLDRPAAVRAVGLADRGVEQAQVVVDLGHRADGRARVLRRRPLLDRDRRREALDRVDVGLLHLLEELPGVGRERLDVAALPLGEDRVEGERGLARAGDAGDDDEPVARDVAGEVLEVVLARAADPEGVHGRGDSNQWLRRRISWVDPGRSSPPRMGPVTTKVEDICCALNEVVRPCIVPFGPGVEGRTDGFGREPESGGQTEGTVSPRMKTLGRFFSLLGLLLVVLALPGQENVGLPRLLDRRTPAPTPAASRAPTPEPRFGAITTLDGGDTCTAPPRSRRSPSTTPGRRTVRATAAPASSKRVAPI